jgi:hypothetical protein
MLCSIYFSLYRVLTLLTPFSPPEVATTPTILLLLLLLHNEISYSISMYQTCMIMDEMMYMDDTFDVYVWMTLTRM